MVFDSFILSDFMTFSRSSNDTRALLTILDGMFLFPATILCARLNGQISISFEANYQDVFEQLLAGNWAVLVLLFIVTLFYLCRPLVISHLHLTYYRRWINEPNKLSFMITVIVVPLMASILLCQLLHESDYIQIRFSTAVALLLCLFAYWIIADLETRYRNEQLFSISMATFMPLAPNPDMSQRERKFARKYQFEKHRIQANYCRQVYQDLGINEFQRLLGKSHALGNLSPMMLNTNPTIDIREKFDDLYHVKSAEWQGFYPSDLQGQIEPVSDEYRDLIYQVCKRRKEILRTRGKEPMWEIEIDPKEYEAA